MAGSEVADAREAGTLLDAQQRSGLPLASLARSRGIDGRSLNAWRINLTRGASPLVTELQLVELVAATAPKPKDHVVLTVRCGPVPVAAPPGFDQDMSRDGSTSSWHVEPGAMQHRCHAAVRRRLVGTHRQCWRIVRSMARQRPALA